ncbi:MAG TPA: hypothetical protein VFX50_01610, partial [Gemmatimonadales bacterium]|nr:hypothetical protein [Gemmatimonadales bacterium]
LTLDGARGRLGEPSAEQPSIRFVPVRSGDVILVCSDGLHRYVDGEELAGHLGARRALGDIASTLVTLAKARGGEDSIALCLVRIGRLPSPGLPDPEALPLRLTDEVGTKLLPRYRVGGTRRGAGRAVRVALVTAGVLALSALGVRGWQAVASRVDVDAFRPEPVARETLATRSSGEIARAPEVPTADPEPERAVVPQPPVVTRVPEPERAPPATEAPRRSVADSIAAARREAARLAPIRERARRDSIAAARAAEEERLADSIAAAGLAALRAQQEQRARDSAAAVERQAREDAAARERALADQRSREQTAREEETRRQQAREARLSAGRQELQDWLWELTNAVKRGDGTAPVLRQGPPRFAEFVTKSKPEVGEARITQMSVSEATGTANAEFTVKWRTEFGTNSTRRVRASASIVPAGNGWTVRGWQILDGAP